MNTQEIKNILENGSYALISGNANLYPAHVEQATTERLRAALNALGYETIKVVGKYAGEVETSLLVVNPTTTNNFMAVIQAFADMFGQESFIIVDTLHNYLIYTRGPRQGDIVTGNGLTYLSTATTDNYTQVGDDLLFSLCFNWEE